MRSIGAVLTLAVVLTSCSPVQAPTSLASPTAEATILPASVQAAIDVRRDLELQVTPDFVAEVDSNPDSPIRYGIRVTQDEARLLDERDLPEAIDMREDFGLVTDRAWVLAVLADP